MNFLNKCKLILKFPLNCLYNVFDDDLKFISNKELFAFLKRGYSVCRYGDGEIALMLGIDLKFQKASKQMSNELKLIAGECNERLIVCIPNVFSNIILSDFKDGSKKFWKMNMFFYKGFWKHFFSNQLRLGNSLFSRFYIEYKSSKCDDVIHDFLDLVDDKRILVIEGGGTRFGWNNDLLNCCKLVKRIICPSDNAYSKKDIIINKAIKEKSNFDIFIVCLGPTATIITSELSKNNMQALDMGNFDVEYSWYLMNAKAKCPIYGKEVKEIGTKINGDIDELYELEVLEVIE